MQTQRIIAVFPSEHIQEILKHGFHTEGKLLKEQELQRNTAEMKFICYSKSQHCMQDSLDQLLIS